MSLYFFRNFYLEFYFSMSSGKLFVLNIQKGSLNILLLSGLQIICLWLVWHFYVGFVLAQENEFDLSVKDELGTESYLDFSLISQVGIPNLDNANFTTMKLLNKFKVETPRVQIGLLQEKDSLETKIVDLYKYYITVNLPKIKVYLGNYLCCYGQGLVFFVPQHLSRKYAPAYAHMRISRGIAPDHSCYYEDNPYLHGVASSVVIGKIILDSFYSSHYIDASINADGSARTIYFDGSHVGYKRHYKDTLKETLYGGRIGADLAFGNLGVTYYKANYKPPLKPNTYTKLSGRVNEVLGADLQVFLKNCLIFGEYAHSNNEVEDSAKILGMIYKFGNFLDLGVSYRDYGSKFHNIHSFAFSLKQDKNPRNERGYYLGAQWYLTKNHQILAYHEVVSKDPKMEGYTRESMVCEQGIGTNLKWKKFKLNAFAELNKRKTTIKLINQKKRVPITLKRIIPQIKIETNLGNANIVGELKYFLQPIPKYSQKEYGHLICLRAKIPLLEVLSLKAGISACKIKTSDIISTYPYKPTLAHFEDSVRGGYFHTYKKSGWRIWLLPEVKIKKKKIAVKYTRDPQASGIELALGVVK